MTTTTPFFGFNTPFFGGQFWNGINTPWSPVSGGWCNGTNCAPIGCTPNTIGTFGFPIASTGYPINTGYPVNTWSNPLNYGFNNPINYGFNYGFNYPINSGFTTLFNYGFNPGYPTFGYNSFSPNSWGFNSPFNTFNSFGGWNYGFNPINWSLQGFGGYGIPNFGNTWGIGNRITGGNFQTPYGWNLNNWNTGISGFNPISTLATPWNFGFTLPGNFHSFTAPVGFNSPISGFNPINYGFGSTTGFNGLGNGIYGQNWNSIFPGLSTPWNFNYGQIPGYPISNFCPPFNSTIPWTSFNPFLTNTFTGYNGVNTPSFIGQNGQNPGFNYPFPTGFQNTGSFNPNFNPNFHYNYNERHEVPLSNGTIGLNREAA